MKTKDNDEKSLEAIGMEALLKAREAFQDYVSNEYCIDPAYFDLRFTAWTVTSDFSARISRVEIESEIKEEK